jgi:hypothetical protein
MSNKNLPNVNKFATGITESLFANYKTDESLFKQAQSTENFVIQSALYQNKNTPLFQTKNLIQVFFILYNGIETHTTF